MKRKQLVTHIVPVNRLGHDERQRMYELMCKYYYNVSPEQFDADLNDKDDVIILRHLMTFRIEGFSTLKKVRFETHGQRVRGIYSGDTIIERAFWGTRDLGKAFLKYLFMEKLKRPCHPLYWFLISKGYKTYLLMANNFSEHYPRYEKPIPAKFANILDGAYGQLFPDTYDASEKLITHQPDSCKLKPGIASSSDKLMREHPRIAFFEKTNPNWSQGTELCCVATMTLWMPFYYAMKAAWKLRRRGKKNRSRVAPQAQTVLMTLKPTHRAKLERSK